MQEKFQFEKRLEVLKPNSIKDILKFLKQTKFDCEFQSYECEIKGQIEPEDIQKMLSFHFEIDLTERNGVVILSTGTIHHRTKIGGFTDRRDNSLLNFHTHPVEEGGLSITVPSFEDIYLTEFASPRTPMILCHEKGLIVYQKPILINPLTGKPFLGEARDLMLIWGEDNGVDLFGSEGKTNLKSFFELSRIEQLVFEKRFVTETNMIVEEGEWGDKDGVNKIMSYINLIRQKEV